MPSFEGQLSTAGIQEILKTIVEKNPASTWLISDGHGEKVVYFSTGGIRLYASQGRKVSGLEEFLVERGVLPPDKLKIALEARGRETLDETLERSGLVPRSRFLEAVTELIYLELCDIVTWEQATYEFYEGNPPPEIFDSDHPALFAALDVKNMAARVREWVNEWGLLKTKVYSERLRLRLESTGKQLLEGRELTASRSRLYRLVDGQRTLRDISLQLGFRFQETARDASLAMREGHLRGSFTADKDAVTTEEILTEIERLEQALDKAINVVLIHKRIATGYEKMNEKDLASRHYQQVGDLYTFSGRIAGALEHFRKAMELSPQNLQAHESLIKLLQETGQEKQALHEIVSFGKKLLSFGLTQRALACLQAVKAKVAQVFEIGVLLAEVFYKLGRVPDAAAEYLRVAREKQRVGALEGLEDLYRRVLAIDPSNKEAKDGLSNLLRRRTSSWLVWGNRLTAAAGILLAGWWAAGELRARALLPHMEGEVIASIGGGDLRGGLERLWAFGKRYPASMLLPSLVPVEEQLFRHAFYRVEDGLDRAERLIDDCKLGHARAILLSLLDWKLVPSQVERAQQAINKIDAARRKANEMRQEIEDLTNAGLIEEAFLVCRALGQCAPEALAGLRITVQIRTEPSGARVIVDGDVRGTTPVWVKIPLDTEGVSIEKDGYAPQVLRKILDRPSPIIQLNLSRQ